MSSKDTHNATTHAHAHATQARPSSTISALDYLLLCPPNWSPSFCLCPAWHYSLQSSQTSQLCHFSAQNLPITPVLKTPYNKFHEPLSQPVSLRSYSFLWSHPSLSSFLEPMLSCPGMSPLMSVGDHPPPSPDLRPMTPPPRTSTPSLLPFPAFLSSKAHLLI